MEMSPSRPASLADARCGGAARLDTAVVQTLRRHFAGTHLSRRQARSGKPISKSRAERMVRLPPDGPVHLLQPRRALLGHRPLWLGGGANEGAQNATSTHVRLCRRICFLFVMPALCLHAPCQAREKSPRAAALRSASPVSYAFLLALWRVAATPNRPRPSNARLAGSGTLFASICRSSTANQLLSRFERISR